MDKPSNDNLSHLESEIEKDPTSETARENLLQALSADPHRFDDPRRLELIEWFLVRPEYRLSSYGPSLDLVRQVCASGRWDDGLEYLRKWDGTWDHPRLREWIAAVQERRLPDPQNPD